MIVNGVSKHVIGYMKDFLFGPEQARTPLSRLSGGERGRLMLARALALPSNLLVLDEPTNDLDLETLDLLQDLLAEYPGTVVVVSHDRDFLDRVATSVINSEGEGRWTEYAGGYSDMVAQRGSGVAARTREVQAGPVSAGVAAAAAPAPARRGKLSFKDKHALDNLPPADGGDAGPEGQGPGNPRRSRPLWARSRPLRQAFGLARRPGWEARRRRGAVAHPGNDARGPRRLSGAAPCTVVGRPSAADGREKRRRHGGGVKRTL